MKEIWAVQANMKDYHLPLARRAFVAALFQIAIISLVKETAQRHNAVQERQKSFILKFHALSR